MAIEKNVNYMGLVRALMQVKNTTPASLIAITEVKMNKSVMIADKKEANPFCGRVSKKQKSNVFINYNYANVVNRRLIKEGKSPDFEAKPRVWGEKLPGTPLVFHKNEYYLDAGFLTNNDPKIDYILDGKITEKVAFESFLPVVAPAKTAENQGLNEEDEVIVRTISVRNIYELTVAGVHYVRTDLENPIIDQTLPTA